MKKFDYYVGIDVSKLTLDVTVLYECNGKHKTDYYKIENNEKSIAQFVKKNLGNYSSEQTLFCFENTGDYSLPLEYYLSDNNHTYWRVAPIEIKRSSGATRGKDDKIDSKQIALYACTHQHKFTPSRLSSKTILKLRVLFTEREKHLRAKAIFVSTSESKGFIAKEILSVVLSSNAAIVKQHQKAIKTIEKQMRDIIKADDKLSQQYRLITSIPGIGQQTAIYIIIATKGFEAFQNWRQLACYSGVAPFPYQSGTSIKGRTKVHYLADRKLKTLLTMCVMSAVTCDKQLEEYYKKKVAEGKSKRLVMNNVKCKLLARVFAVIKRGSPFIDTHKFAA